MKNMLGKWRVPTLVLAGLVVLAGVGWVAAQGIRSPAQVAADTAAPSASAITVPVVKRKLSTIVIVRGTIKYGQSQGTELATSLIKQGSDLVTRAPRARSNLRPGSVALTVDGRPVFVLPGRVPMHRDLQIGDEGPDVRQLEQALRGLGISPGLVDGRYDAATAAGVSQFYIRRSWDPFGPTDAQQEQLRSAQATAAQARDTYLQSLNAIDQARRTVSGAEKEQSKADIVSARDALGIAKLNLAIANSKVQTASAGAQDAGQETELANANANRDQLAADADVASKRDDVAAAVDSQTSARLALSEVPPGSPASQVQGAEAVLRQATSAVARAQSDLDVSKAAASSVRLTNARELQKIKRAGEQARRDLSDARAEEARARAAVTNARDILQLSQRRSTALRRSINTATLQAISAAAKVEADRLQVVATRLQQTSGVQVPANEVLFFPHLPLRVDSVTARRGSSASGRVMTLSSTSLTIDSSLSSSDKQLVKLGDKVTIEEEDLGIKGMGTVTQVAPTPGTNRVDPSRFYFAVNPSGQLPAAVGSSVKLSIAVNSTKGDVLAVPANALSVGGNGTSRLQVRRGGKIVLLPVSPGLAAEGLVEVTPKGSSLLRVGDLVIVGEKGAPTG